MSDKFSKRLDMSAPDFAADMKRYVEIAGEGSIWRGNVKAAISLAAQRLGLKPRRARALYYKEARVIPVNEYYTVRERAQRIARLKEQTRASNEHFYQMALSPGHVASAPHRQADGTPRHSSATDQAEVSAGDDPADERA